MIREINLYNSGLNQEMAVPDLLRSQSEGDGVDLREGSEEGVEIVEVLVVYDLYQKAELACRM